MAAIDDKIIALATSVTNLTTVDKSAVALLNGISAQIAAAVADAQAKGATAAQLQALTDLNTAITNDTTDLAAAVTANTPAVPPTPPTPPVPPTA